MYAPFISRRGAQSHFSCRIEPGGNNRGFVYVRGARKRRAKTAADLLFLFDKDLTIALQRQRRDLFFVHAGVVEFRKSAVAFVAPSGTGKSVTTLALLYDGFGYVSDELLPVDVESLHICLYPRALCLKKPPPAPYALPADTLDADGLLYLPIRAFAQAPVRRSLALGTIFFLERVAGVRGKPRIRRLGSADASARLYANALNPLAHSGLGLDAAISIAKRISCYSLQVGSLSATSSAVRACLLRNG